MYASLKKQFRNKSAIVFYSGLLFLCITSYAFGATPEFVPLTGLPGLRDLDKNTSIATYINAVYLTIIAIGALIGVVRLAIAGVKYSLDDIVTHKQDAKDDIKGVLLGLAILLIPFIVLNTIYPGLTNLDVLSSAPKVNLETQRTRTEASNSEAIRITCFRIGGTMVGDVCKSPEGATEKQRNCNASGSVLDGKNGNCLTKSECEGRGLGNKYVAQDGICEALPDFNFGS